ncbi:hypothetical protein [Deinococcus sp. S9]|uniref:hypothetical protein n=1 Tax=Deinococcus sp. S9 TaxID=2545754 RepID=UPI0010541259|nr:hypothetical protein [Deinococcus sp. S9]TDE86004.1 hypothetical protein E0686_09185 [Deinococcus sp. S9]
MFKRLLAALLISLGTWPLVACDRASPAPEPNVYRTTEGGPPLSWELKVWNANKTQLLNTITENTPSGIAGGFKWQLQPNGDNVQLELTGRNDRMALPPRGVVALKVDGQAAFYGIVPDPPSAGSPDKEQAQALGGREALRKTLLDSKVYRDQGVYQIVRDILSRLCPPALAYDPTLIGDGSGTDAGPTLSTYYAPTSDLVAALDSLAKSAGTSWGVDAQGRVFFGRPQPAALTVAYAGQPWKRLRVQGRETVTQAVLRIVTAPAGPEAAERYYQNKRGIEPYLPATMTTTATHELHNVYRASVSLPVPEGLSVIREVPGQIVDSVNLQNADRATDDDPETYASSGAGNVVLSVNPQGQRLVGVRIAYSTGQESPSTYKRSGTLVIAQGHATNIYDLPPAKAGHERQQQTIIFPPDARDPTPAGTYAELTFFNAQPDGLRIHALRLLVVDEGAAARLAQSMLQVPYGSPAEITLHGLVPPVPTLTVTGSPDGDVTGPTSLWEYEHSPGGPRTTRVRLGSDGQSDAARAIKFAVRGG